MTVREFMLKKYPTNKWMDCPISKEIWGVIQEYADEFHKAEVKKLNIPDVSTCTEIEKKPIRYKCLLCGRDKFTQKTSHYCVGGYRKHKIKWQPIYE